MGRSPPVAWSAGDESAAPLGLEGRASHIILPQQDCNLNGVDDATDIAEGTSLDGNGNGVPDACETCQTDLGHAGPGPMRLAVCGDDLTQAGSQADFHLGGIPDTATAFLIMGLVADPTPLEGGTVVPFPWLVLSDALFTIDGAVDLTVTGGGGDVVTSYVQAMAVEGPLFQWPNALEVQLGLP